VLLRSAFIWRRGANENTDSSGRAFLPKRHDFGNCSDAEIQLIADKLNQRPRKRLGFRSAEQVFDASLLVAVVHFIVESDAKRVFLWILGNLLSGSLKPV